MPVNETMLSDWCCSEY